MIYPQYMLDILAAYAEVQQNMVVRYVLVFARSK